MATEHTNLTTLFEAERKGYNGSPNVTVKLTLESYQGKRYALWASYKEGSSKPDKSTSIRESELAGFITGLNKALTLWTKQDDDFTGELSHEEYAKGLDWG